MYAVWICHDGEFRQVLVDQYIPCADGLPLYSRSTGNEIWVNILEKAYAKLYGAYQQIRGGKVGRPFRDLTGAPYDIIKITKKTTTDDFWALIIGNLAKKNFIAFGGYNGDVISPEVEAIKNETIRDKNYLRMVGLPGYTGITLNHAYALLDAQEVINSEGVRERIIQLRNVNHR